MSNKIRTKANLYEVELGEQLPHKDYQWRVYMDGDEILVKDPFYRFQAVDLRHAIQLISRTIYKGNIKCITKK